MRIKAIVIGGEKGDIEITLGGNGAAIVTRGGEVVCEVTAADDADERWAKAQDVACMVYGQRRGRPNATGSMVREVLDQIELVAD